MTNKIYPENGALLFWLRGIELPVTRPRIGYSLTDPRSEGFYFGCHIWLDEVRPVGQHLNWYLSHRT